MLPKEKANLIIHNFQNSDFGVKGGYMDLNSAKLCAAIFINQLISQLNGIRFEFPELGAREEIQFLENVKREMELM